MKSTIAAHEEKMRLRALEDEERRRREALLSSRPTVRDRSAATPDLEQLHTNFTSFLQIHL